MSSERHLRGKKTVEISKELWEKLMHEKIKREKKSMNELLEELLDEKGY